MRDELIFYLAYFMINKFFFHQLLDNKFVTNAMYSVFANADD